MDDVCNTAVRRGQPRGRCLGAAHFSAARLQQGCATAAPWKGIRYLIVECAAGAGFWSLCGHRSRRDHDRLIKYIYSNLLGFSVRPTTGLKSIRLYRVWLKITGHEDKRTTDGFSIIDLYGPFVDRMSGFLMQNTVEARTFVRDGNVGSIRVSQKRRLFHYMDRLPLPERLPGPLGDAGTRDFAGYRSSPPQFLLRSQDAKRNSY